MKFLEQVETMSDGGAASPPSSEPERTHVKVTFDDGDYFCTTINLPRDGAYKYYMGQTFTKADETQHRVTKVDFLE